MLVILFFGSFSSAGSGAHHAVLAMAKHRVPGVQPALLVGQLVLRLDGPRHVVERVLRAERGGLDGCADLFFDLLHQRRVSLRRQMHGAECL